MTRDEAIARLREQLGDAPNKADYADWLTRQSDYHLAQLVGETALTPPVDSAKLG